MDIYKHSNGKYYVMWMDTQRGMSTSHLRTSRSLTDLMINGGNCQNLWLVNWKNDQDHWV